MDYIDQHRDDDIGLGMVTRVATFGPLTGAGTIPMTTYTRDDVKLVDVQAIPVGLMEHHGEAAGIADTVQRFTAWRKAAGLTRQTSPTFTIFHDPEPARSEDFHIDLCAGSDRPISPDGHDVKASLIPAGRCATLRVVGSSEDLSAPANFLYRDWLPASGEELRDFPLYCQRVSFFPDVPAHEAVTDLFLPLQ